MVYDRKVVSRMRDLIDQWDGSSDNRSIFLKCYSMMTSNMLDSLDCDEFQDCAWVHTLLVRFADYYFDALTEYEQDPQRAPVVWTIAHQATRDPDTMVVQNLLLGVNAHINYDLVFALADVLENETTPLDNRLLERRYADHCKINEIIAGTVSSVQDNVIEVLSPGMDVIDKMLGPIDEWLIEELIRRWRDDVWYTALDLLDARDDTARETKRCSVENRTLEKCDAIKLDQGWLHIRQLV